jgi:hypothetical protein
MVRAPNGLTITASEEGFTVVTVNAGMPRRACAVGACGLAALAAAPAAQAQTSNIRPGKNITVFANVSVVGAFGYFSDSPMRVEIVRDGHAIASASGTSLTGAEGIGLNVNHAPDAGAVQPGDCWSNYTPRILPGDQVRVTGDGGVDTVDVDDIRITVAPYVDGDDNVVFEGVARYSDGAPIPVSALDSGAARADDDPRVHALVTKVEPIDDVGGYRAYFERAPATGDPYGVSRNDGDLGLDALRDRLLVGDLTMGYGHLEIPPPVVQLTEGLATSAPAEDCPNSRLAPDDALTTLSDDVVNIASGDLVAGGVSAPGKNVSITVDDGDAATDPVVIDPTDKGVSGAWSATVTRDQVESLSDGTLVVSASFGGSPGNSLSIDKDTVAPGEITANPVPATYPDAQSVTLDSGDSSDIIRFTRNGWAPGPRSQVANGPFVVPSTTTITARAWDTAGNTGPVGTLKYTIAKPNITQIIEDEFDGDSPRLVPAAVAPVALGSSTTGRRKPYLRSFAVTPPRVKRRVASKSGLRLVMRVDADAEVVRIRVWRKLRNGRRLLVATGWRSPSRAGLYRVRLSDPTLRRKLRIGSYVVDATPGANRRDLGTVSRYGLKIVKR